MSNFLRLLVLGAPKSGKTTTCISTAPEGAVYVINSDQPGATAPAAKLRTFQESDLVETPQALSNTITRVRNDVKAGKIQTVVWDTVTEFGRKVAYLCEDEEKDGRRAWGRLARFVMQGVDSLVRLPCHVIILGHSVIGETGSVELDIPGQSGRRIPASFNDVWLLEKRGAQRMLTCKRAGILGSRLSMALELEPNVSLLVPKAETP